MRVSIRQKESHQQINNCKSSHHAIAFHWVFNMRRFIAVQEQNSVRKIHQREKRNTVHRAIIQVMRHFQKRRVIKKASRKRIKRNHCNGQTIERISRYQIKIFLPFIVANTLTQKENSIHQIPKIRKRINRLPNQFFQIRKLTKPYIRPLLHRKILPKITRIKKRIQNINYQRQQKSQHHRQINLIAVKLPNHTTQIHQVFQYPIPNFHSACKDTQFNPISSLH